MPNRPDDASLPTDKNAEAPTRDGAGLPDSIPDSPADLDALLADLDIRLEQSARTIRKLMADENPAAGVFHAAAIHEAKQHHMQLRYMKDLCHAKRARLHSD